MSKPETKAAANTQGAALQELENITALLRTRCAQHAMQIEILAAENVDLKASLKSAMAEVETLKNAAAKTVPPAKPSAEMPSV